MSIRNPKSALEFDIMIFGMADKIEQERNDILKDRPAMHSAGYLPNRINSTNEFKDFISQMRGA